MPKQMASSKELSVEIEEIIDDFLHGLRKYEHEPSKIKKRNHETNVVLALGKARDFMENIVNGASVF